MIVALLLWLVMTAPDGASYCTTMKVTGYVRGEHSPRTYDGTSIYTAEPIAAASWDIPLGWYVTVEDVGTFRVADRGGGLGSSGWVDIAVWTRTEAYALTGVKEVCVYPPPAMRVRMNQDRPTVARAG